MEEFLRFEEDTVMGCGSLSTTLQKLHMGNEASSGS